MATHSSNSWYEIRTPRLLLRAATQSDLHDLHRCFIDEETMRYGATPPHPDLETTQEWLDTMIDSPHHNNGIRDFIITLLHKDESNPQTNQDHSLPTTSSGTTRTIGTVGCWDGEEIGFMLDRAVWGRGYATEAVGALLTHLWDLPFRDEADNVGNALGSGSVVVTAVGLPRRDTVRDGDHRDDANDPDKVVGRGVRLERVKADVDPRNVGSLRVLEKLGFKEIGRAERTFETHLGWCDSVYLAVENPRSVAP